MAIDWTKIYNKHKGSWVALKADQRTVVASAKTAHEALHKAELKGYPKAILFRVPAKIFPYVGSF